MDRHRRRGRSGEGVRCDGRADPPAHRRAAAPDHPQQDDPGRMPAGRLPHRGRRHPRLAVHMERPQHRRHRDPTGHAPDRRETRKRDMEGDKPIPARRHPHGTAGAGRAPARRHRGAAAHPGTIPIETDKERKPSMERWTASCNPNPEKTCKTSTS